MVTSATNCAALQLDVGLTITAVGGMPVAGASVGRTAIVLVGRIARPVGVAAGACAVRRASTVSAASVEIISPVGVGGVVDGSVHANTNSTVTSSMLAIWAFFTIYSP